MVPQGHAGLWHCIQADGTILFNDDGGPGCRERGALAASQSTLAPNPDGLANLQRECLSGKPRSLPNVTAGGALSSRSFSPASRVAPAARYRDRVPEMWTKGWNIPNKGDIQLLQLGVRDGPVGTGPSITTAHHFLEQTKHAWNVAVLAAAKAVPDELRFLHVALTMPPGAGIISQ